MTPIAEALKKEHPGKKDYWQNELKSFVLAKIEDHDGIQSLLRGKRYFQKVKKRLLILYPPIRTIQCKIHFTITK